MTRSLATMIENEALEIERRFVEQDRRDAAATSLDHETIADSLRLFLAELVAALRDPGAPVRRSESATGHGAQRFAIGFDVSRVVREYSLTREIIYDLAEEQGLAPTLVEHRTMARFLVNAIADSATEYGNARDQDLQRLGQQHLAFLAHELRNPLGTARLALSLALDRSDLPRTPIVESISRALGRMSSVLDDSLVSIRLKETALLDYESFEVAVLIEQLFAEIGAEAESKDEKLVLEGTASLYADRRAVGSAVSNLLRNAVKFSHRGGTLHVRVKASAPNVVIEVEDRCGGLPEGAVQKLFDPFVQLGADRSGFGLGLAIAHQVARAHGGALRVHDLPGRGCVFALDLPARAVERPAGARADLTA
ncbi:MAG: histidine kinase, gyrase and HSP90-like ATPase family protein [Labilithrix sp.]|nr:histidine kinase, gyrase and HSP90-like ATPase family protein [Labilithrix sp.]